MQVPEFMSLQLSFQFGVLVTISMCTNILAMIDNSTVQSSTKTLFTMLFVYRHLNND